MQGVGKEILHVILNDCPIRVLVALLEYHFC